MLGRRIKMFRCVVDPQVSKVPKNAHMMGDGQNQVPGEAFKVQGGIEVTAKHRDMNGEFTFREFFVPDSNISCIEYFPEELSLKKKKAE